MPIFTSKGKTKNIAVDIYAESEEAAIKTPLEIPNFMTSSTTSMISAGGGEGG